MDLTVLAEEWAKRLKSCEYAGEVVVPEAKQPVIAKQVRPEIFSPRRWSDTTSKCLLILAINCMYYDHDEEGFWVHFCNLLNMDDNQQSQALLGEMLERELRVLQEGQVFILHLAIGKQKGAGGISNAECGLQTLDYKGKRCRRKRCLILTFDISRKGKSGTGHIPL